MGRKLAVVVVVLGLALAAAPQVLAGPGGISPPSPETESGEAINQLYWFVFGICAFVFVAVEAALILFIVRFRRRRATGDDVEGPQIHGNTRLEVIWTIIPALVLVGIAIVVFVRTPAVQATGGGEGSELRIRVEAHQFYWEYRYPSGVVSLDTLVLPVDRPIALELTSFDVDHSWWVPDLTGKKDAIPGRTNVLRFRVKSEGTYDGRCAELCGILHAVMPTAVEVVSAGEFSSWLARRQQEQGEGNQVALGKETWEAVCAKCHGLQGEGDIGPPIQGNGTLTNRPALRDLLENGQDTPTFSGYMPPVGRGWPDFQLRALVAFIRSNEKLAGPAAQQGEGQSGG
jgi:cytochrome c oxidase subunit II